MAQAFIVRKGGSSGGGGDSPGLPAFTYTGTYETELEDEENWKIKFLSSGTLTVTNGSMRLIDVFIVGAGSDGYYSGGGGGGYTKTLKGVQMLPNTEYQIVVGAHGRTGGASSAFGGTANGGAGNGSGNTGNNGGSGGGGGYYYTGSQARHGYGGAGGSDGGNGARGRMKYDDTSYYAGGEGQGTTTREFGESTGTLYSGGGGGAGNSSSAQGGAGGGGRGSDSIATSAATFYGGGGGGAPSGQGVSGKGYQGIVIIRNARIAA